MTVFWLRDSLYRDTAPVPLTKIQYRDCLLAPIKLVPRHAYRSIKFIPGRQKHAPYPPCTVTVFWLKYQDPTRCLRRLTQPPHIAGPLGLRDIATNWDIQRSKARVLSACYRDSPRCCKTHAFLPTMTSSESQLVGVRKQHDL